jgi:AbrB family looped-hinge helix DNA binding protein
MPKRLQVIFENAEYRQLQKAARRARLTVSALVRQTLRDLHGNASPATAPASPPVVREPGRHRYAVAGRKGVTIDRAIVVRSHKAGESIVTISPKYQVVIPRAVRESMRLAPGQKVHVFEYDGRVEIVPAYPVEWYRGSLPGIDTTIVREHDRL